MLSTRHRAGSNAIERTSVHPVLALIRNFLLLDLRLLRLALLAVKQMYHGVSFEFIVD